MVEEFYSDIRIDKQNVLKTTQLCHLLREHFVSCVPFTNIVQRFGRTHYDVNYLSIKSHSSICVQSAGEGQSLGVTRLIDGVVSDWTAALRAALPGVMLCNETNVNEKMLANSSLSKHKLVLLLFVK